MKSIQIVDNENDAIELKETNKPEVKSGYSLVKIHAAALNRRDQWIREGLYPGIKPGVILGSDGCGTVEEGPSEWLGREVIINPNINWGSDPNVQSSEYTILGLPQDGTFARYCLVENDKLFQKPSHLTHEEAAALPLAGMTAYRAAISKGKASTGKKILITGAGGGVSQFAIQFAIAKGADVFITSSSGKKISKCIDMGVKNGFNYTEQDWPRKAKGEVRNGFDAIIDSAGGQSLNDYIKLIRPGGRIIHYGATTGKTDKLDLFRLFWSQAQIMGSTMANDQEFVEMLELVNNSSIIPMVDRVFPFDDYKKAFDRIKSKDHFGKIVLKF